MKKIYAFFIITFCLAGFNANGQYSKDLELQLPDQPNLQKAIFGRFAGSNSESAIIVSSTEISVKEIDNPSPNYNGKSIINIHGVLQYYSKRHLSGIAASKFRILDASLKLGQDSILLILLSDGTIMSAEINYLPGLGYSFKYMTQTFFSDGKTYELASGVCDSIGKVNLNDPNHSVAWGKIVGDAVYTLIADNVSGSPKNILYVSHDAAHTFVTDTTGLQGDEPFAITLDANQKLYVAGRKGLYMQDSNAFTWTQNKYPTVPSYYKPKSLFIASNNYIYSGIGGDFLANGNVYLSKDNGANWTDMSSAFNSTFVHEFCEDIYGNVYAIADGKTKVYKSTDKGANWSVISQPIDSKNQSLKTTQLYQSIAADSHLIVGTIWGAFVSRDQGSTWNEYNTGIVAKTVNGIEVNSKNEWIVSLNSGIYNRAKSDSIWSKKYPSNAYKNARKIYKDKNNTIYTTADNNYYNELQIPLKSTDDGATYVPDSNGIGKYSNTSTQCYWVDVNGNQYMGTTQQKVVSKLASGNNWADDVSGLPNNGYVYSIASSSTKVFAALTGPSSLYSRDIASTSWTQETNGLSGEDVWILTHDSKSNIYGGNSSTGNVMKYNSGSWAACNRPNGNWSSSTGINALAVDDSGTIFAAYNNYSNTPSYKLFYSKDNGNTWMDAGFDNLVTQLKSFGDTTVVVTPTGVFFMTRQGLIAMKEVVNSVSSPIAYLPVSIFPNPANTSIHIELHAAEKETVITRLISLNGQTIHNETGYLMEGRNSLNLNISNLTPGIYIYQLQGKNRIYTGRFVKQ